MATTTTTIVVVVAILVVVVAADSAKGTHHCAPLCGILLESVFAAAGGSGDDAESGPKSASHGGQHRGRRGSLSTSNGMSLEGTHPSYFLDTVLEKPTRPYRL